MRVVRTSELGKLFFIIHQFNMWHGLAVFAELISLGIRFGERWVTKNIFKEWIWRRARYVSRYCLEKCQSSLYNFRVLLMFVHVVVQYKIRYIVEPLKIYNESNISSQEKKNCLFLSICLWCYWYFNIDKLIKENLR